MEDLEKIKQAGIFFFWMFQLFCVIFGVVGLITLYGNKKGNEDD